MSAFLFRHSALAAVRTHSHDSTTCTARVENQALKRTHHTPDLTLEDQSLCAVSSASAHRRLRHCRTIDPVGTLLFDTEIIFSGWAVSNKEISEAQSLLGQVGAIRSHLRAGAKRCVGAFAA
jgi:hypothetical protein